MSFRSEAERILNNKKDKERKLNALEMCHRRYTNLALSKAFSDPILESKKNTVKGGIIRRFLSRG